MAPFDEERQRKRERERTWGCVWERKLNKNKREERERMWKCDVPERIE